MKKILKDQIQKYLPPDFAHNENFVPFFEAVNKSYINFEEQFKKYEFECIEKTEALQHAQNLLVEDRKKIKNSLAQINHIKRIFKKLETTRNIFTKNEKLNAKNILDYIEKQSLIIEKTTKEKDELLLSLREKNGLLSDYAQMISHDLKTPLQSINTLSTWLMEDYADKLDQKAKNQFDLLNKRVEKLNTIIDGIFHLTTLDKKKVIIDDISIIEVVEDVKELVAIPDHITINLKTPMPTIKGNKLRIHQIFLNLISNAIKNINKNQGFIEIGAEDQQDYWKFYVKDNGQGIDKKYHKKIFKPFVTLESNTESSGLGLSINKKIIKLRQGTIWLESEPDRGATFHFTLKKLRVGAA